ncbi:phosphoribosylamine--glycine ligase [Helicobacter saguini]|uniref:phosphoribosylamine--glycine ligase n=1 Tax=Helicobacter saguini TaxID=1548018 RepID=UPI001EEE7E90|nr:phosphoribosylamine--glycine ligase [Helicobacter saguini]
MFVGFVGLTQSTRVAHFWAFYCKLSALFSKIFESNINIVKYPHFMESKVVSMKNVLIIGNGGREYAIALTLYQQKLEKKNDLDEIYFAPENAAATKFLNAKALSYKDFNELYENIQKHRIYLVIIGPEAPIVAGLSDFLWAKNILVFAPSRANAELENSKVFMKSFVSDLGVPTAKYKKFTLDSIHEADKFIESLKLPIVLKASGLCGGKGVLILDSKDEARAKLESMLRGELFGEAGREVVIEEYLQGYELSIFALSNGVDYTLLPPCQDHKRLLDGDKGVNTGGMGAYTSHSHFPARLYDAALEQKIKDRILTPTFKALYAADGRGYQGVLFAGLMIVNGEPYLLEFNVRFGDPECEVLMPLFESSLLELLESYARGVSLDKSSVKIKNKSAVCVVMSSADYALDSKSALAFKGDYPALVSFKTPLDSNLTSIDSAILDSIESNLGYYIFANVSVKNNEIYANSGRSILAVGLGDTITEARNNAYKLVENIDFKGKHYRKDIAYQAI